MCFCQLKRLFTIFLLLPFGVMAQFGGSSTFEFVNLPYSATENALGGSVISRTQKDVSFALKNPSLLDSTYHNDFSGTWGMFNVIQAGINHGTFAFAHSIPHQITLCGGIHFVNYGQFEAYTEDGIYDGHFYPIEYEFVIGASRQVIKNLYVGVNFKPILSYMETYSSYGLLFDFGASYRYERANISLLARNLGWQLKPYTENNREGIPCSLDFGFSQKLEHAPIGFNITYQDLQQFNLSYSNVNNALGETETNTFIKNFLKHINLSAELYLGKTVVGMIGYNFRQSSELSFGASKHGSGLSCGFALNFSRFQISYSWSHSQVAANRNYLTLKLNANTVYSVCKSIRTRKNSTSNL